jgi:hypothetical protein
MYTKEQIQGLVRLINRLEDENSLLKEHLGCKACEDRIKSNEYQIKEIAKSLC